MYRIHLAATSSSHMRSIGGSVPAMPHIEIIRAEIGGTLVPDGTITARLEQGPGDGALVVLPANRGFSPSSITLRIDGEETSYFRSNPTHMRPDAVRRYCWTHWE